MSNRSTNKVRLTVLPLFPTLVGETNLPDCQELNRELAFYVRSCERESENYATISTVVDGWQSGPDFLEADVPAIRTLRKFIEQSIDAFLLEWVPVCLDVVPTTLVYSYGGWAVVLRRGGFQHEHIHARKDIVGIYYVEIPSPVDGARGGDLTLIDPRAGRVASSSIWESTQMAFHPEAGKLLLFPAFVPHRVDLVREPGERISINFDITLVGTM